MSSAPEDNDLISRAIKALRAQAAASSPENHDLSGGQSAPDNDANSIRIVEALLFAASEPLDLDTLRSRLPEGSDVRGLINTVRDRYANAGVNLVEVGGRWRFQTAEDMGWLLRTEYKEPRKLSQAALETLAIIAYHQPVTRAEIEEIRGVAVSRGVLDPLLDLKWIRLRGRRRMPGRPITYGITDTFMDYFGLANLSDLPGVSDLKAAGLLSGRLPPDFTIPVPGRILLEEDEDLFTEDEAPRFHTDFLEGENPDT